MIGNTLDICVEILPCEESCALLKYGIGKTLCHTPGTWTVFLWSGCICNSVDKVLFLLMLRMKLLIKTSCKNGNKAWLIHISSIFVGWNSVNKLEAPLRNKTCGKKNDGREKRCQRIHCHKWNQKLRNFANIKRLGHKQNQSKLFSTFFKV